MGIAEAEVVRDFLSEPVGSFEGFVFGLQLNFSEDEAGVLAFEDVDFPAMLAVLYPVACFGEAAALAKFIEHGGGFFDGDGIFEFAATKTSGRTFDGEKCLIVLATDADGGLAGGFYVALLDKEPGGDVVFPGVVLDEEFSFDFVGHGVLEAEFERF